MTPEALYEAWREEPSLHWNEIINPVNTSPPGAVNETPHFVRRWNRVADAVAQAVKERDAQIARLEQRLLETAIRKAAAPAAQLADLDAALANAAAENAEQAEEIARLRAEREGAVQAFDAADTIAVREMRRANQAESERDRALEAVQAAVAAEIKKCPNHSTV